MSVTVFFSLFFWTKKQIKRTTVKERQEEEHKQRARFQDSSHSSTKKNDDNDAIIFVREQSSDARVDEFYRSVFLEEGKLHEMSSFWNVVSAEPPPEIRRSGAVVSPPRERRKTRRIVNDVGRSFWCRYQRRQRRGRRGRVGGRLRHGRRRRGSLWRR